MFGKSDLKSSIVYFLFFISGIAALVYQIIWQRLLTYFTGSDITSISLIVSAYMAGLGLGSLAGGFISDRLTQRRRILLFGISEALIGVFAVFSKLIFYDYLYGVLTSTSLGSTMIFFILFSVLLIPTFLMGASLPLLSKVFVTSIDKGISTISSLYFVNTIGAALGAILPILTVQFIGFTNTIFAVSALNFFCLLISLYIVKKIKNEEDSEVMITDGKKGNALNRNIIFWVVTCCITGFIAVALEMLWFRMISIIIKPLYITFPALLFVYIAGLAIGSKLTRFIPKSYMDKAKCFFYVQCWIVGYVLVSIVVFMFAIKNLTVLDFFYRYLGTYEPVTAFWALLGLYGIVLPYFVFIPTILMGFSFVLLQSILQDDLTSMGKRLGLAQFMNIVGSSLGAIFTSYVFIENLGTANSFKLIIAFTIVLVFGSLFINRLKWGIKNRILLLIPIAFGVVFFVFPSSTNFWSVLHGKDPHDLILREDETGIAAIKFERKESKEDIVFCNNLGQSKMDLGNDDSHVTFGLLPSLLHPAPKDIAVIGLGSASTLYGVLGRSETVNVVCFEIIRTQKEVLIEYDRRNSNVGLRRVLNDPRVNFLFSDARYSLRTSDKKYDIIEADALRTNSAYSGNLYSKEYFELLKSRLNPGGFAVTWAPSDRVVYTVASVFKYYSMYGTILIASDTPIQLPPNVSKSTQDYYKKSGIDVAEFLDNLKLKHYVSMNQKILDVNTDLFPKDEFGAPQP